MPERDAAERLAQALHSVGLFELEKMARDGQFADMQYSPERKRMLIRDIEAEMRKCTNLSFTLHLMGKLRDAIIHGDYD